MVKKILALCFLLCASFCWGQFQDDYVGAISDGQPLSNISWAKTNNAWHLGNTTLATLANSGAGYQCGQDSALNVHCYNDYPTNSWALQSNLGTPHALAVVQPGQFWSLQTDSTHCNNNGYGVNSFGSSWTYRGECLSQIAASPDGTVGGANLVSHNAYYLPVNGSWTLVPGGPYWIAYYPVDATDGAGLKTDGSVWKNVNGTLTQLPSSACTKLAVDTGFTVYALCSNAAYRWNVNTSAWDQMLGGPFTDIANGDTGHVWVVGPTQSGANVYRLQDVSIHSIASLTGNTTCNNSCPPGSVHTWSAHVSGGFTGSNGASVPPASEINQNFYADVYDPFTCLDGDASCAISLTTNVTCNMMGTLEAGILSGAGLGGTIHFPCWPPINAGHRIGWLKSTPTGQVVDVYLDSTKGIPNGPKYTALCAGISSWALLNNVTYHCHSSNGVPSPRPLGNYIYVESDTPYGGTEPCEPPPYGPAPGHCVFPAAGTFITASRMTIDTEATTVAQWTGEGAHEEGHDNFMGDCFTCYIGESLMGGQVTLSSDQPLAPTACDVIWYPYNYYF